MVFVDGTSRDVYLKTVTTCITVPMPVVLIGNLLDGYS